MQTVLFYEHTDPASLEVACYEGGRALWHDTVARGSLSEWLKTERKGTRLQKDAVLVCVLKETAVARVMLEIPEVARTQERRRMAENAIGLVLGEAAALVGMVRAGGDTNWLVSGVKKDAYQKWQSAFGIYSARVKWVSALDCALAFTQSPPSRGVYALEAPLWTAVFFYEDGRVMASRAQDGRERMALEMALFEETKAWGLAPYSVPFSISENAALDAAALEAHYLIKTRAAHKDGASPDRRLVALIVGCVVLPALLWFALSLREAPPPEEAQEGSAQSAVVVKSDYSSLIEGAYREKSARITILNQEASEGALAIHGRCSEVLDLADYMKSLENAQTPLHPLLLDMTKKSDKERYYYEFVLEISLEGREGHEGA